MTQIPFLKSEIEDNIHNRFRRVARQLPDAVAIEDGRGQVTYARLDEMSDRIAQAVLAAPPTESPHIGIWMEHGTLSLATILGILKAGRSFVIFPPGMPEERLTLIWEDALRPTILVASSSALGGFCPPEFFLSIEQTLSAAPAPPVSLPETDPSKPAAIFYTSGSVGDPKGVIWTHELILHAAYLNARSYRTSPGDRYAMLSAYGFGAAMTMSFVVLLSGATLLLSDLRHADLMALIAWIREERVEALAMPPVELLRQLLRILPDLPRLETVRLIILGGDLVYRQDVQAARQVFSPNAVLILRLAGSETMLMCENRVDSAAVLPTDPIPVGLPVPDKELTLLDENRRPVPPGESGEIAIRSRYLSPGYWRRPDLDAAAFLPDPEGGDKRIYLTGDIGRLLPDGQLEYLGRKDQMVKVHGYSVQLELIDRALRELDGVRDGVASIYQTASGVRRLAAYLIAEGARKPSSDELRARLSTRLAAYMLPSAFVWMESFPRTKTGKVDRKSLPMPSAERPPLTTPYLAPRNSVEERLASIWENVLGVDRVGVTDNFFELGGDSLLALQMTVEVEKALDMPVPQSFFASPMIAFLSKLVEAGQPTESAPGKFALAENKPAGPRPATRTAATARLGKYVTRRYSWLDVDRLIDWFVGWQMETRSYLEAGAWAVRWSANSTARRVLYRRRFEALADFMAGLPDCKLNPADIFPQSVLTNVNFGLYRFLGEEWREIKNDREAIKRTRSTYWRSLAEIIEASSVERLDALFPMEGFQHMQAAITLGRGVILLSFHGATSPVFRLSLAKRMNVDAIPAISHRIPARQSEFGDATDELPYETALALNTQIALFAQKRLQDGGIVYIVGDTSDAHGPRYSVEIGGRAYQVKAGFAELALNTGAAILPFYGRILPDSRSQIHFLPPLEPGAGSRAVQAERLVNQYVAFVNRVWSESPAILWWNRIRRHLMRPAACG
jgi:amino acid adenylation domain-containing protein